jgi:hypothetical protein
MYVASDWKEVSFIPGHVRTDHTVVAIINLNIGGRVTEGGGHR